MKAVSLKAVLSVATVLLALSAQASLPFAGSGATNPIVQKPSVPPEVTCEYWYRHLDARGQDVEPSRRLSFAVDTQGAEIADHGFKVKASAEPVCPASGPCSDIYKILITTSYGEVSSTDQAVAQGFEAGQPRGAGKRMAPFDGNLSVGSQHVSVRCTIYGQ